MAAGLGFKTFTTGEVLTAANVNGYLMQGVLVFASAAARDAAITSPQEGQFAYTKDTNGLWYYDGAAWVASGATGDIEGVTAGIGISGGGTSGTVTVTNSMATAIDAKGDLVAGTGADTFAKLTVGANNTVLTADSAEATGLKWATPAASGFVGCRVYNTTNQNLSNSAFTAVSNGTISSAELEYLKGWLAQSVQVNAMVNKLNADFQTWKTNNTAVLTSTGYSNTTLNVLFGLVGETIHQLGDVIKRYNDVNATSSNNIKSLSQVFWQEWQQSRLRVPALIDAATGDTKTIQKILTKMGNANGSNYLTGIKTNDSTGTYRWDFSGNTLQKIQIN